MFRRKEQGNEEKIITSEGKEGEGEELFYSGRKTVRELVSPMGVNPNPLDYMVIHDNGLPLYTMCFYIDKLPKNATFASTFAPIFNFPEITSSVFINPMTGGKSSRQLDKRIISLDTERITAEKDGDRNRYRKIMGKMNDAEAFAQDVESGDNRLYEVSFLFTVQSVELDRLRLITSDIHNRAREKGIELSACYGVHPEAFVSGYPTNRIFKAGIGPVTSNVIKKHVFDKGALCTLFNHTRSSFSHKGGIVAGRDMSTGQLVTFNIYDASHTGFGLLICGKTGTGKSATIKMYLSRYIDFDYRIRSIDFESRGTIGEYGIMAEAVGGINFQIKQNSMHIINLFEVDEEEVFDEVTGTEYAVFRLNERIVDIVNMLLLIIKNGNKMEQFSEITTINRIVTDTVAGLFAERGIRDGEIGSLYTSGKTISAGRFGSGRVKKPLPTITDFYKAVLVAQKHNRQGSYEAAYQLLLDAMKDSVKELYYCSECRRFFQREEYREAESGKAEAGAGGKRICPDCGGEIVEIHGVRSYFDGQSTIRADQDTPHINIDISQITEEERNVAMIIAMNWINEHCARKNSENPKKAKKMVVMIDELHKTFPYEEARIFVSNAYRTYRKRHVSPWVSTQALADFQDYKETRAIVKNSTAILLLKQDYQDRQYIKDATPLTDSQIERVLSLGGDPNDAEEKDSRRGEICLIDNGKAVFIKVDYLKNSESRIVETDMSRIMEMYGQGAR